MIDTNEENFPAENMNETGTPAETENFPAEEQGMEAAQPTAVDDTVPAEGQAAESEDVPTTEGQDNTDAAQPVITEVDKPSGESKFESLVKPGQIPAGQVLLETRGLVKAYHGRKVVNDVNLTIFPMRTGEKTAGMAIEARRA